MTEEKIMKKKFYHTVAEEKIMKKKFYHTLAKEKIMKRKFYHTVAEEKMLLEILKTFDTLCQVRKTLLIHRRL